MCALQNKWGYSECHKMGNLWPVSAISQTKGVRWVGIKTLTVLFTLKKQQGVPADEQRHWERVIKEKQSLMFLLLKFLLILLCSPYMVLRNRAAAFFWGGRCGGGCVGSSAAGIHHLLPARLLHLAVNSGTSSEVLAPRRNSGYQPTGPSNLCDYFYWANGGKSSPEKYW